MNRSTRAVMGVWAILAASAGIVAAEENAKVDPSGTWKWERTFGDNHIGHTLRLKLTDGKLSGTYATIFEGAERRVSEPVKIDEAKLEGDKLTFKVTREFNDRQFTIAYSGTVSENGIKGTSEVDFDGNPREFDWDAKRVVDAEDVIGTWQLKIETPNRVIEPTVKLTKDGETVKGTFVSERFGEIDLKDVAIKDNQLTFTVAFERDGNEFTVAYTAQPRGDAIKGKIKFDFGGDARETEFEGKRVTEKKDE